VLDGNKTSSVMFEKSWLWRDRRRVNVIFRTLITGMVSALCAMSPVANVPPLVLSERTGNLVSRRDAEGTEPKAPLPGATRSAIAWCLHR